MSIFTLTPPGLPRPPQPTPSLALSAAQIALLQRAFIRPQRSMGGMVAQVILRERHKDVLEVTDHPVERGAPITDHAFKRPVEVTIECGWSNSPPAQGFLTSPAQGIVTGRAQGLTVQEVYKQLLKLQDNLELVDVYTGKRKYSNMILQVLETETDRDTENVLLVQATFREVILVGTEVVTLGAATSPSNQKAPEITAPTINAGFKQLQPAPFFNAQAGP